MILFSYTKPKMIVADEGKHIRDKKDVYVSGMSLKDIGKKYSYIYKVNEEIFIYELIKRINNVL